MKLFTTLIACVAFALAENHEGKRLIALSDTDRRWLSPAEIDQLDKQLIGFADATDGTWDDLQILGFERLNSIQENKTYPARPSHQSIVKPIHRLISPENLKTKLTEFVNAFPNRYMNSTEGAQSCGWIYDQVKALTPSRDDIKFTVSKVTHPWKQYSVVARIEPTSGLVANDIVVLSAHQDSINRANLAIAPGADDDGSGSISIFESLKQLLAAKSWKPTRPVEFHWYAAEETGLRGSAAIVKAYAADKVDVYAQVQQDMVGYVAPASTPVVAFATDFSYIPLVDFLKKTVEEYLTIGWADRTFGYGASDHASWYRAGYPSSFPFEGVRGNGNPYIHSTNDTLDKIDWVHVADFTKFSIAYVVELTQGKAAC